MKATDNWFWHGHPVSTGQAVVFDIDGVLANCDERQHYLASPQRDWGAFFAACEQDSVVVETTRLLEVMDDQVRVVLLTGRPTEVKHQTLNWLEKHHLRWDLLIMRDRGDYKASLDFKRQSVRRLRMMGFDIRVAFEDDPKNKDMFEEEGVPCLYIHSGYYEDRDRQERQAQ